MRVCFLYEGNTKHGGIGRAVSVLANGLCQTTNININVLSLFPEIEPTVYPLDERIIKDYLYSNRTTMSQVIQHHGIKLLSQYLVKTKTDVIIACGVLYYPITVLAAKLAHCKSVCWEHTNPACEHDYRFQGLARKFGAFFSDRNVVISKSAKEYYNKRYFPRKNVLIYNPAENALFEKASIYSLNSRAIVSVGRLSYPKNYPLLLDVAEKVLADYPEWHWDIYGDGEEKAELERIIHEKRMEGKVVLKGAVNDMYSRYEDYSMLVLTSRYEGFPMVLIEGAARGLPLVSFDIQTGPNEIIHDCENGFLIEPENIQDMTAKIEQLIVDEEKRTQFSAGALEMAQHFRMDHIAMQWVVLFGELSHV